MADTKEHTDSWDFPGWGTAERIDDLAVGPQRSDVSDDNAKNKLGIWKATAICGNDIASSCLYVTAIASLYAGAYAPIALSLVAVVLYLYRKVYSEVGTALPLNGGAYNVLLNTTSKGKASLAACLTILSYIATAVISANAAMHYAHSIFFGIDVVAATIAVLGLFAVLNIVGVGESAIVALVIFVVHVTTLTLLVCFAGFHGSVSIFLNNWHRPAPGGILRAVFFGFSAAMLGISGFESSANFIEEQKPGVFPKTLRNMWIVVTIFNPLISVLALSVMPLNGVLGHTSDLLARMGYLSGGRWLSEAISVDAVLVLSGAVLTSYVGVTGLVRRMSLDRCLPQFLLITNKLRGTNHWIILIFFGLCVSILMITHGRLVTLAGVYTIAFLGVMSLFALGNILLKVKRARLPRAVRASWPAVIFALLATLAALTGNILINPTIVRVFLLYFLTAIAAVGLMFMRVQILKFGLIVSESLLVSMGREHRGVSGWIIKKIRFISNQGIVYFTEDDSLVLLNRAAVYVLENEQNNLLHVVHCYSREEDIPPDMGLNVRTIDRIYPELKVDLLFVKGDFGPPLIDAISNRLKIQKNYMFIGTPSDRFPHSLASLGGVRLIM